MLPIDKHPDRSKLRWFAALWFPAFLAVVGTIAWRSGAPHSLVIGVWLAGGVLSVVGLAVPVVIRPVFVGLSYATFPIGFVVSMTIMAILYFGIVTPMAVVMRLLGRDTMQRRLDPTAESYWQPIPERTDASTYFRQS